MRPGNFAWAAGFQQYNRRNHPDHPAVAVSWFEALAFCQWLSELTGERITLPTEQQWQRAAQGNANWRYPWGDTFDPARCNSGVGVDRQTNSTSPVTRYEGKGNSPYGVVDMCGNVWEWCLTDHETGLQDVNKPAAQRSLRGGSWNAEYPNLVRADFRGRNAPDGRLSDAGFRLARL